MDFEKVLEKIQDLTDALSRAKEHERLIKAHLDADDYITADELRVILNYPKTAEKEAE